MPKSARTRASRSRRIADASLMRASASKTCAESTCEPLPIVQTCRSCTSTTPDRKPERRDGRHHAARRNLGRREAPHRLEYDDDRDPQQQAAVCERGQDLEARIAEAAMIVRRPPRLDARDDRDAQGSRVHEHVRRIGQQRDAVRDDTAHDFEERDRERAYECPYAAARPWCRSRGHGRGRRGPARARAPRQSLRRARTASAASIAPNVTNVLVSARAMTAPS